MSPLASDPIFAALVVGNARTLIETRTVAAMPGWIGRAAGGAEGATVGPGLAPGGCDGTPLGRLLAAAVDSPGDASGPVGLLLGEGPQAVTRIAATAMAATMDQARPGPDGRSPRRGITGSVPDPASADVP